MCCCSIGKAWGSKELACDTTICSSKGPGYYSYDFKEFTNNGMKTTIKCENNKCETKTIPVTPQTLKPAVKNPVVVTPVVVKPRPVLSKTPQKTFQSSYKTTIVKTYSRGPCGKSTPSGSSKAPCYHKSTCGGNGQSPCLVKNSSPPKDVPSIQPKQIISRCGAAVNRPCSRGHVVPKQPVVVPDKSLYNEAPEIITPEVSPPPRVIVTERPVRPCALVSHCIRRCGPCSKPTKSPATAAAVIEKVVATERSEVGTTVSSVDLPDVTTEQDHFRAEKPIPGDCEGELACNESPEEAGSDDVFIPPPDAKIAIQENPAAPIAGCGGLECDSPEAEAGIEIEPVVALEVVPCVVGQTGCEEDQENDEVDQTFGPAYTEAPQVNPAAPDQDCLGFSCDMDNSYSADVDTGDDYYNETGDCLGADCGDVNDGQDDDDVQPDRSVPEFGCNGTKCSSPEAEQGVEIETHAQGPCGEGKCDKTLVAELSKEPNLQPQPAQPTEDCVSGEGCGNVEDAVDEISIEEPEADECTGDECVVESCDTLSGQLCDPDAVMTENAQSETEIVVPCLDDCDSVDEAVYEPEIEAMVSPVYEKVEEATTVSVGATTIPVDETTLPVGDSIDEPVYPTEETIDEPIFEPDNGSTSSPSFSAPYDSDTYSTSYDDDDYEDVSDHSGNDSELESDSIQYNSYDSDDDQYYREYKPDNSLPADAETVMVDPPCYEGYRKVGDDCVDIDECKLNANRCGNGTCVNTDGGYICRCNLGFQVARNMGFQHCEDINECAGKNVCGDEQEGIKCINLPGDFECRCEDPNKIYSQMECISPDQLVSFDNSVSSWYEEVGTCYLENCFGSPVRRDVSYSTCCCDIIANKWTHSSEPDTCSSCPTHPSSEWNNLCQPSDFSYHRQVPDVVHDSEPRGLCHAENLNQESTTLEECCCSTLINPLWWGSSNTPCLKENEAGFYQQCPSGNGNARGENIDECLLFGEDNLCPGGRCIDLPSRFQCTCTRSGYYWTGNQCENFNECSLPNVYCRGGTCIDTEGSYECICAPGEEESDGRCQVRHEPMKAMLKPEAILNFAENNICYSSSDCNMAEIQQTSTSRVDCCCNGGGAWGSEDACTTCPELFSAAYEQMCSIEIGINVLASKDTYQVTTETNSVTAKTEKSVTEPSIENDLYSDSIYSDSDYMMNYDYESSMSLADQPQRGFQPIKVGSGRRHKTPSMNKAAPISNIMDTEKIRSRGAFACGLPGGCGHGNCIKAPRGVTCKCHRGWQKTNQGRCVVRN